MALVNFEKVVAVQLAQTSAINASVNDALGPITSDAPRTTLYDPIWGYYTFGQALTMDYHDTFSYMDRGVFTITGEFTIDAENAIAGNTVTDDPSMFLRCVVKYEALQTLFQTAGEGVAPTDFLQWGSASDPRMIPLPFPLVDVNSNKIYAVPQELNIEPGRWGAYIRYTAVLKEAKFPPGKVLINDIFIDDGIITITCPAPIMIRTPMSGCSGEVIQIRNYTMTEYNVEGTVNGIHATGNGLTSLAQELITDITAQSVSIGTVTINGSADNIQYPFPNLDLDDGVGYEIDYANQLVKVSIKAKAAKI